MRGSFNGKTERCQRSVKGSIPLPRTNHLNNLLDEVVGTFISLKSLTSFVHTSCLKHFPFSSKEIGPVVFEGQ